jgi:hypothetical protein
MGFATTKEAFASLIRAHVSPALRSLGFKGSGGIYAADLPTIYVIVGFQRSAWGDRRHTDFTVNLTVASIASWEGARATHPVLPARPSPNVGYMDSLFGTDAWQSRLGFLMPEPRDRWWSLSPDTNLPRLSAEVVAAIRQYGLPAIEEQVARRGAHVTFRNAD